MKFCPECFAEFDDLASSCPQDGSELVGAGASDPLIGQKIAGRYTVLSVIGRGGMGVVYKARHDHLDRIVAVKMLHAHLVGETEALKRFHREAKAVSRVKHPHTVTLYDFGVTDTGQPFIVMDFIEGTSLKKILKDYGPIDLARAQAIFEQVVSALSCAHAEGVIHRDLKPENIMLSRRGEKEDYVEVVDFGISKLKGKDNKTVDQITQLGDVCGSPPYMSPEQCLVSGPVDARSDIYSLAIVLYESLSGRLPFKAKTAVEMIDCHLYASPTPFKAAHPELQFCDALNAFFLRALAKEPEKRPQTMEEFGSELKEAIYRDTIKLTSFRNLSQALAAEAQLVEAGALPEATVDSGPAEAGQSGRRPPLAALIGFVSSLFSGGARAGGGESSVMLAQCPYCSSDIQPNIRFCLDCGRNLPSPQELTKLRSAQGVFHFSKLKRTTAEAPEFSSRARRATSRSGQSLSRIWLLINLLILALIAWFYYSTTSDSRKETTPGAGALTAGGGKQGPARRAAPAKAPDGARRRN